MQGSCSPDLPVPSFLSDNPPTEPLLPGQCFIRVPFQTFFWNTGINQVWIDNLSIATTEVVPQSTLVLRWSPQPSSRLWITNSAFEGGPRVRAVFVGGTPAFIGGARPALHPRDLLPECHCH